MYTKKNTRLSYRSNRRSGYKRSNSYSNPKSKNKGNLSQQYNKFLKLAKEAFSSGDRIQSEYYYQFTDHYYRLMIELGMNIDDSEAQEEKASKDINQHSNNDSESNQSLDQNKEIEEIENSDSSENDDLESIQSVPFISEPAKKKSTRNKKINV
tara:strand:- start:10 stop:471 length:462 start_codon:yes stop_codon:yes gene_type:complete